nr:MAG TPA: hypothetical protein [Caudoviricetes sp.]
MEITGPTTGPISSAPGFTISLPLRKEQRERKGKQVPEGPHQEDFQVAAWKSGPQE